MLGSYEIRTDLALEAREQFTEKNMEIRGVEVRENYDEEKDIRTTVVKITTENGAKAMGRPQGNYITIEAPGLSMPDEDYHREISREIATHLRNLISLERETSILVAGLGNLAITADSLGPHVVENLRITRHMIKEYGLKSLGKQSVYENRDSLSDYGDNCYTFVLEGTEQEIAALERGELLGRCKGHARTLGNLPNNYLHTEDLASYAQTLAQGLGIDCEIYGDQKLKELGLG